MAYDYDLFVIGAGSGGVRAANRSAKFGAKVAIAEQADVGGTCVIRGCVPKKLMVYASEFNDMIGDAAGYGWEIPDARFDWATLRDRIQTELGRLSSLYIKGLEGNGVTLFQCRAIVKDPHTVHLASENRDVTAEKILVAAGGVPFRDDEADPDRLGIVSDDVFHLDKRPDRLVVAGGGYIAIEFAHIFARLGTEVTLVYRGHRLLRAFDREISERVEQDLIASGIRYIPNTIFARIDRDGDDKTVELTTGEVLRTDEILWAIGRRPRTSGLGLEDCGVEKTANGAVIVDQDYRTACPSIFSLGDVTDRINLTPVAIREAMAFASTQFGGEPKRMDYRHVPKAVFCQPPVGSVGMTEDECLDEGHRIDVFEADFRPMKNVLAGNDKRMLMKLIVDAETDRVLGCHMVGEAAPEMVQIAAIAVKAGLTKAQFDETCALHPTSAEELVTLSSSRPGKAST
ncbi:putative glutathione reductase [Parvularcula bermudensis HTCC2503]|uniref:Putative glutathione reductase n=1 Tax=Parvularcula bermudensis (strain ATCC BAA-594 / HTCC2503 / KCTC 12087) TaxID=314260 RepID=E0TBP3_PARBH|nr:glutathione-disulfide reductase [Parvularcula bermudensis]ADM09764.1 putative glutathione reductase [Parvularcula bermudensis HTCC2503]